MIELLPHIANSLDRRGQHDLADRIDTMTRMAMPQIPTTSTMGAKDMFGPMWHGTTPENMERIREEGFRHWVGEARENKTRHGLPNERLTGQDFPPPVHFLGFGTYLTTNRTIAKEFNLGSTRGLEGNSFFLNSNRIIEINFTSPQKMTDWWIANGYEPKLAAKDRIAATAKMTEHLASICDAVHFKGRGLGRLLDGNQICVYDTSKIVRHEKKLDPVAIRKSDGMRGRILERRTSTFMSHRPFAEGVRQEDGRGRTFTQDRYPWVDNVNVGQTVRDDDGSDVIITQVHGTDEVTRTRLTVKWNKGGTEYNVNEEAVDISWPE